MKKTLLLLLSFFLPLNAQVKFDAAFESGNLNTAVTTDSINYTVTTRTDIGGRWFYFRITGVGNRYLRVNITTSDVTRAMYSYDNIAFTRFTSGESPAKNLFQKTFEKDTVFVAYYTPYNLSYLQNRISEWNKSEFVSLDTIGITDRNFPIQELIITDNSVNDDEKEHIWIHSRTHPGETPSSFHFDGIIQKLLEDDDVINYYRKKLVFHLIPFTNPEGVYFGRSRTNFDGIDVESNWSQPENLTSTEVKILKERMLQINNKKIIKVFLNLHSQASQYCTFWIHTAASTNEEFYKREYQFSYLNVSDNPYFVPADFRESALQSKFPEGWLWNQHADNVMALTYETPYDFYSTGILVTEENLYELGYRTVYAIAEYLELSHPKHFVLDNRNSLVSSGWINSESGKEFYGKDFLYALQGSGKSAEFISDMLEPGIYEVYGWWASNAANADNTSIQINGGGDEILTQISQKTNGAQWNYVSEVTLNKTGPVSVKVTGEGANGNIVADAFRIIYKSGLPTDIADKFLASDFILYQNYPNPFNPSTTIKFKLSKTSMVTLKVYNSLGEEVGVLINEVLSEGLHQVVFNTSSYGKLSSGIYYYTLNNGNTSTSKGMIFMK